MTWCGASHSLDRQPDRLIASTGSLVAHCMLTICELISTIDCDGLLDAPMVSRDAAYPVEAERGSILNYYNTSAVLPRVFLTHL